VLSRGYTGREIRWVLIGTHYRQSLNFTFQALDDARVSLQRLDTFRNRLLENRNLPAGEISAAVQELASRTDSAFRAALFDDLNISSALAALFDFLREMNRLLDTSQLTSADIQLALKTLETMDSVLAVCVPDESEGVPADIQALADERQAARKAKDFARADALRQQISDLGWTVEDTPKGPRCHRK